MACIAGAKPIEIPYQLACHKLTIPHMNMYWKYNAISLGIFGSHKHFIIQYMGSNNRNRMVQLQLCIQLAKLFFRFRTTTNGCFHHLEVINASFCSISGIEIQNLLLCSGYAYRLTMLNNSPRQWPIHQYKATIIYVNANTCTEKAEMNHQRQSWAQMVLNGSVISSCLCVLILMITVHLM